MNKSASTINIDGELGKKISLPDGVFGNVASPLLTAVAVRVYLSNKRKAVAKTKTRSEVRKTTAKMYRQKGTGRARHGAYSAPIFVGGGVAHGPDGRQNYKKFMTKKNTRRAVVSALTEKANENMITLLSESEKIDGKTKQAAMLVSKLNKADERLLVITATGQKTVRRAFANVGQVTVIASNQLSAYKIIRNDKVLITDEGLREIVTLFK